MTKWNYVFQFVIDFIFIVNFRAKSVRVQNVNIDTFKDLKSSTLSSTVCVCVCVCVCVNLDWCEDYFESLLDTYEVNAIYEICWKIRVKVSWASNPTAVCAWNRGLHKQWYWTARPKAFSVTYSHTRADKIDCFIHKKIKFHLWFATAYYSCKGHEPWHTLYNNNRI